MKTKTQIKLLSLSLLVILLISSTQILAQSETSVNPGTREAKLTLQHVTVVVSDFSKSEKFYKEILGLKEIKADWLSENQMFLSLGGNLELHVGEVSGVEIRPSNFNHFAMSVPDLDSFLAYLKEKGIEYSSLGGRNKFVVDKRPDGVRQTFFQDPDGYWIEINDFQ